MKDKIIDKFKNMQGTVRFWVIVVFISIAFIVFFLAPATISNVSYQKGDIDKNQVSKEKVAEIQSLDTILYDQKLVTLANNPPQPQPVVKKTKNLDDTVTETIIQPTQGIDKWPVKTVYPNVGAILPFNRVVAYYGNLYSKKMGVLGEYDEEEMLARLDTEVRKWEAVDPETPVIPALHYIAVVAQGTAGVDGKYRFRMGNAEIDKVLVMAEKIPARNAEGIANAGGNAIVFLDIQVALSDIQTELPHLKKYLEMPNVHLGIDPDFSMKTGARPGKVVGTMDGEIDVNFAINYLSQIVKEKNLTPKILVVHRYTRGMLTNSAKIKPTPEVQVVIHMDGWGGKDKKIGTYKNFIYPEPVQFTGFKLFYKNDIKEPNTVIFEPSELMKLNPRPSYIQYQ